MTYYDMQQEKIKRLKQALQSCSMHDCSNACVFSNKHPFACLNEMHKELVIFINQLEDKNYKLEQNLKQCENGYKLELERERYENFVLKNKIIEYENINQQLKQNIQKTRKETAKEIFMLIFQKLNVELNACKVDLQDNKSEYWQGKVNEISNTIEDIKDLAKQYGVEV